MNHLLLDIAANMQHLLPDMPTGMHFVIAYKWVFFLLPLPLLVFLVLPPFRKRKSALLAPFYWRAAAVSGQHARRSSWISRRSILAWITLSLCWVLLLGAASSPRFEGQPGKKTRTVRSFLVAADISFSMAQRDWTLAGKTMTRWEAIRFLLKDFIAARKSDQIGLEMFATHAYLQAPLTTDLETVNWLLDQTEVGMAGQMTSIGEAIAFGIKIFQQDTIKQRVMLLMTDGVDGGTDISPLDAAVAAKRDSVTIYTLGIGTTATGGYAIDEKLLTEIAETTGGKYFRADSEQEMQAVYAELNKLQPVVFEENTYKPIVLLYMYPLGLALLLSLAYYLLSGLFRLLREAAFNSQPPHHRKRWSPPPFKAGSQDTPDSLRDTPESLRNSDKSNQRSYDESYKESNQGNSDESNRGSSDESNSAPRLERRGGPSLAMVGRLIILPSIDWHAFHFLRPWALWLFIPLVIVLVILILGNVEQRQWKKVITPALRPFMFSKGNAKAIILPLAFLAICLSSMILALAGPTWKMRQIPGEKIPSVVMITLDLSKSMLATDIQPSRLGRAKMKIADFVDANPRARVGLIAYAGTPHAVLPFTADYKLIKHHAASLENWAMPIQGTNLPLCLTLVDTMMQHVEAPSTILLMTDVIDDAEAAALTDFINNSIHRLEILLFSIPGGAPVPDVPGVESKQSPTALSNMQQNKKIHITTITLDKSDVEGIAKRISDNLMFEKDTKENAKDWDDKGWVLLIPALLITLFWFRKGWAVFWSLAPFLLLSITSCSVDSKHADWWYTDNYQGELWSEKGDYGKAAVLFSDDSHKAMAYYKAGDFQSAAVLLSEDTTANGRYNYGLTLTRLGLYDDAITAFRQAASEDPLLGDRVSHNIDAAKLMQDQAHSVLQFQPHPNQLDSILKNTEKSKLKERKPTSEDEKLSSDTEVKKMPTSGDRLSDEVASDIHRAKEQKFPPKDFKMDTPESIETKVLMQKTNNDPGEFLHRRFEIQQQKYYPTIKQGKETW